MVHDQEMKKQLILGLKNQYVCVNIGTFYQEQELPWELHICRICKLDDISILTDFFKQ